VNDAQFPGSALIVDQQHPRDTSGHALRSDLNRTTPLNSPTQLPVMNPFTIPSTFDPDQAWHQRLPPARAPAPDSSALLEVFANHFVRVAQSHSPLAPAAPSWSSSSARSAAPCCPVISGHCAAHSSTLSGVCAAPRTSRARARTGRVDQAGERAARHHRAHRDHRRHRGRRRSRSRTPGQSSHRSDHQPARGQQGLIGSGARRRLLTALRSFPGHKGVMPECPSTT
jgi:hypothetical protein